MTSAGQQNYRLTLLRIDQRYQTLRTSIRTIGWVAAAYFTLQALEQLAGRDTGIWISVLADFKFKATLALAGAAMVWAIVERMLRHRKTESLQKRIKTLEIQIDPGRSTSGLTPKGKTNPKDKVR